MTPMIMANRRNVIEDLSENRSYCLLTQVHTCDCQLSEDLSENHSYCLLTQVHTCDCQLSEVSVGSCEVIITGYVN